jgi:kinesin family protein 1
MYAHSNELEEVGVVSLTGVNVESDPHKELLLGVRFILFSLLELSQANPMIH